MGSGDGKWGGGIDTCSKAGVAHNRRTHFYQAFVNISKRKRYNEELIIF